MKAVIWAVAILGLSAGPASAAVPDSRIEAAATEAENLSKNNDRSRYAAADSGEAGEDRVGFQAGKEQPRDSTRRPYFGKAGSNWGDDLFPSLRDTHK